MWGRRFDSNQFWDDSVTSHNIQRSAPCTELTRFLSLEVCLSTGGGHINVTMGAGSVGVPPFGNAVGLTLCTNAVSFWCEPQLMTGVQVFRISNLQKTTVRTMLWCKPQVSQNAKPSRVNTTCNFSNLVAATPDAMVATPCNHLFCVTIQMLLILSARLALNKQQTSARAIW